MSEHHDLRCCDDCGDTDMPRRTRCVECGSLTCRWCFHHHFHVARKQPEAACSGSSEQVQP